MLSHLKNTPPKLQFSWKISMSEIKAWMLCAVRGHFITISIVKSSHLSLAHEFISGVRIILQIRKYVYGEITFLNATWHTETPSFQGVTTGLSGVIFNHRYHIQEEGLEHTGHQQSNTANCLLFISQGSQERNQ